MEATANYYQVQEMTPEETRKMLMKCKKAELVSMLMEVHKIVENMRPALPIENRQQIARAKNVINSVNDNH